MCPSLVIKFDLCNNVGVLHLQLLVWIFCNTSILNPFALNAYDVYIVINHGVELKKIHTIDLAFYVSAIKNRCRWYFVLVDTL